MGLYAFILWPAGSVKQFFHKSAFRPFKVIDFGANRKGVCDFLLVRHSNLGPILHRFIDIADFCAHDQPLFSLDGLRSLEKIQLKPYAYSCLDYCRLVSLYTVTNSDRESDK